MDILTLSILWITMLAFGMLMIFIIVVLAHCSLWVLQLMKNRLLGKSPMMNKSLADFILRRKGD